MMRGPSAWSVAVRKPDGDIAEVNRPIASVLAPSPLAAHPGHPRRGRARRVARDRLPRARDLGELRGAGGGRGRRGRRPSSRAASSSSPSAIAIGFALLLFKVSPALITNWLPIEATSWFVIVEGLIRVAIFIAYLVLISLLPDLKRVFQYHAAEHKAINALRGRRRARAREVVQRTASSTSAAGRRSCST